VRGPAPAHGRPPLSATRRHVVAIAILVLAACREPPAREMRRVAGVNVEIRAIGLPRPPEPALAAAFAAVTQVDGAAADRAVDALRAAGARKGLVNLGGAHVAVFGEPLVVAVPDPGDVTRPRWASFSLAEGALSRAAIPGRLNVTVVAQSASEADAVAHAALPFTADEALALIARRGASGFVQIRDGTARVVTTTPGFRASHDLRPEEGVVVRP
jgi:hypothetical protein